MPAETNWNFFKNVITIPHTTSRRLIDDNLSVGEKEYLVDAAADLEAYNDSV